MSYPSSAKRTPEGAATQTAPQPETSTSAIRIPVRQRMPPGPEGLPFVGNLLQFQRDPLGFMRGLQRSYGDSATVHIGKRTMVAFFRPDDVHYFMTASSGSFAAAVGRDNMRVFLGDGLLTTDGDIHRQQRRLVQPAFHKKRVEGYGAIMTRHTEELLATWRPGQQVNIAHALQELTLRIVVEGLFGVNLQTESADLSRAFTAVIEDGNSFIGSLFTVDLPFTPYHKALEASKLLDTFVYRLIAERRADTRDTGDVLSMLLASHDEDGASMTDVQARDQAMTLIAAGHETTSNALTWTFYLLDQYPDVRRRLVAELASVLGGRTPRVDDLPNLPYLDWVITESMRMYPPAWIVGRTALVPFERQGYEFPAGTRVMMSQWVMHHLPDIWGDPEVFRPDRWDPARGEKVPQGAYYPFGMGTRMCIGMPFAQLEARLVLATILQRFTPQRLPDWPVRTLPRVTLRMRGGLPVTLAATSDGSRA
ncbi:MAG: cytochrome P450 [Ktedonobacterales bacterium]